MINIRQIITAAALMLCSLQILAMNDRKPDFAFPAQVAANAETNLDKALKSSDFKEAIHQFINLQLARTAIDADSIKKAIAMADSITPLITDPPCHAIMYMLTSRMYADYYSDDRWMFDLRELPLTPLPDDISEWSGEQFKAEIDRLITEAMADPKMLSDEPTRSYSGIISADRRQLVYYPTLLDFMAAQAISLYESTGSPSSPRALLEEITRRSEPGSAPYVMARTRLIQSEDLPAESYQSRQKTLYDRLRELYNNTTGQQRCIPLAAISQLSADIVDAPWLYGELRKAIADYPSFYNINSLKNALHQLEVRSVRLDSREVCAPGDVLKVTVHSFNVSDAKIALYRLPDMFMFDRYYQLKSGSAAKLIRTVDVKFSGKVPFRADAEVALRPDLPGYYIVVPIVRGISHYGKSYNVIHCTGLATGLLSLTDKSAIVVNPLSGAPVSDVTLGIYNQRNRNAQQTPIQTASTGSDGISPLDTSSLNGYGYMLAAQKGSDSYAIPINLYPEHRNENSVTSLQGFTDLALYRPGDEVKWMGVAYEATAKGRKVIPDRQISVSMTDVNSQTVDTVTLTTDRFGRVNGAFVIPKGQLTGHYSIQFKSEGKFIGAVGFEVSDYKLPTFKVEITAVANDTPVKGAVTVSGNAMTYAGMPLAGAAVKVSASEIGWAWWRSANGQNFYTSPDTVTDEHGHFDVVIPASALSAPDLRHQLLSATATVTSATAESQTASKVFTLGLPYYIAANIPADIDAEKPTDFNARITGPDGKQITDTLTWEALRDSVVAASGQFASDRSVSLSSVPSGVYTLRISLPGKDCRPMTMENVAIYRLSDPMPPRDELLWTPVMAYKAGEEIIVGTGKGTTNILLTCWTSDSIISRRWLSLEGGIHRLPVAMPDGLEKMTVTIMTTHDYKSAVKNINVSRPTPPKGLRIMLDTFRDRVVPGSEERWTLRVVPADSTRSPQPTAVIVDMYNAALDRLTPHSLSMHLNSVGNRYLSVRTPATGNEVTSMVESDFRWLPGREIGAPAFNTYGRSFYEIPRLYEMAEVMPRAGMSRSVMMKSSATNRLYMAAKDEMADNAVEEEVAEDASADGGAAVAGNDAAEQAQNIEYRPSEIALAMFHPMLVTDNDGRLALTFTVPDANTTWRFIATGFNTSMENATESRDIVAAKRVMVTPNAPRFLRNGDKTAVGIAVFNNSDTPVKADVTAEWFDPVTGQTVGRESQTVNIQPMLSSDITTHITVPAEGQMLGLRVRAVTPDGSDGQQNIIPLLPADVAVVESDNFYLAPSDSIKSVELPKAAKDMKMTLTYCDNPLWYVITSLPGMQTPEFKSAPDAASSIFSTVVAREIIKRYPEVAKAVKYWSESADRDSTLTSMLERNADLKTLLLKATPWQQEAMSDTERMQRLALLFDRTQTDAAYRSSLELLEKLQQSDGGMAWNTYYPRSSEWATEWVAAVLGELNRIGYFPADDTRLESIYHKVLGYLQDEAVKRSRRDKDYTDILFAMLVSAAPDFTLSADGRLIVDRAVQYTVGHWKELDVPAKIEGALLLISQRHKAVASEIMRSVSEYAVRKPQLGMWWPSVGNSYFPSGDVLMSARALLAYSLLDPESPQIEPIRQWIIIQKQAMNWGDAPAVSHIVASLLASSPAWVEKAGSITVQIDKKDIAVTPEAYTGSLRVSLPVKGRSLTISRSGHTPAWGAVVSRYTAVPSDIKAMACEGLSIEKRLLRLTPDGSWADASTLKAGDRVKVVLTVKASREIDYMAINDQRAACLEPVEQLPEPIWSEGICFYRENLDAETRIFIDRLPKGTYQLAYEMWVNNAGSFASGIATAQSQYAPELTAHSSGSRLVVEAGK